MAASLSLNTVSTENIPAFKVLDPGTAKSAKILILFCNGFRFYCPNIAQTIYLTLLDAEIY